MGSYKGEKKFSLFTNIWFRGRNTLDCLCCDTSVPKTIKHLFINSKPAQRLWKFFGQALGITYTSKSVMVFWQDWWKTPGKNQVQKMMIQITPVVICWELWKKMLL
ncbi:hypothetical protein P3L10_009882 [Capsicum annuum]